MPACVAVGCTNRPGKKVPGISFHRFPAKTELRQAWILACGRKNFWPSKWSCLCSLHFSEDLIDRTSLSSVRLRDNAVPNIFPGYPSYLKNVKITVPEKKNTAVLPKEPATSTAASETTLRKITLEELLKNQPTLEKALSCVPLESTDSVPTSTEEDHENETLEVTIFNCSKIEKEPAASIMTRETTPRKITMSETEKFVHENDHIITVDPTCSPASDESALVNRIAEVLESTHSVFVKSYRDAATSPIRDYEYEILTEKLIKLQDTNDKYRKKIKLLHQDNRRSKKQTLKFKQLYEELKGKDQFAAHDAIQSLSNSTNSNGSKRKCLKQPINAAHDAIQSLSNSTNSDGSNEKCLKQPIKYKKLETKKYVCYIHNLRNET